MEEGWREPRGRLDCHTLFIGVGFALSSDLRGFCGGVGKGGKGGGARMIDCVFGSCESLFLIQIESLKIVILSWIPT